VLSTSDPLREAVILIGFVALALAVALSSVRLAWKGWPALERSFEASSQLAVRITVVLVFGLVLLASQLGLDVLLGGFAAGMITRTALKGHELTVFESKLTAVGFGFFVPFFFVTSGLEFDLNALGSTTALLKLAMFLCLFVLIRGTPAVLLYRGVLSASERAALAWSHAPFDRRRPGRSRDDLHSNLPLRRPGPEKACRRAEWCSSQQRQGNPPRSPERASL